MIAIWYLMTLASLVAGVVRHPRSARCPAGWWLATGVQRDGSYACYLDAYGPGDDGNTWTGAAAHLGAVSSRVWCRANEQPLTDGDRVWCR